MKTLICVDRDGTLIYDSKEHLFLGSTEDWKDKIQVLPTVVEGLKLLRQIPDVGIYMITNQSGVAIKDLPLLTEEKANEVCEEVIRILKEKHALIDGYFVCSHVTPEYTKTKPDVSFEEGLVCHCDCIKPRLGMVFSALKAEGVTPENVKLYVMGDRASDAETALNMEGTGILVPFESQPGEEEKAPPEAHVARNFLEAADFIKARETAR